MVGASGRRVDRGAGSRSSRPDGGCCRERIPDQDLRRARTEMVAKMATVKIDSSRCAFRMMPGPEFEPWMQAQPDGNHQNG